MNLAITILGGGMALLFLFIGWRNYATRRSSLNREKRLLELLLPILKSFEENERPDQKLINELAEDPFTRDRLYYILSENNAEDLFPEAYLNHLAAAESALVFWLNHGNELGASPTEIIFTEKRSRYLENKNTDVEYYLFKFREETEEETPYWMVGIAGPYLASEPPYTFAPGTFSTFREYDSQTPDEHVDWLHEMMQKKGMY